MTPARLLAPIRRVRGMDRREVRFRATCEIRKRLAQAQHAVKPPSWDRGGFEARLLSAAVHTSPRLQQCRVAARAGDWREAHLALAAHLADRDAPFPLRPDALDALAEQVRHRFPEAANESLRRAERIIDGRYDVLGYRDLHFGHPPDWHLDPVSGRRAPRGFWASVPYLDPAAGDHKVIWELNRHQHWLALGRAWVLTGDRRPYREFVTQLHSWLAANPPLDGVNWASMLELGFRSISWLWALHLFAAAARPDDPAPWTIDLLVGLDRQMDHVEQNLSLYFSPNTHLSGEALALYAVGSALPELASSARWRAIGRDVLLEEATRQVNADGGHAELSAHYHRYSTDFYLLALRVARLSDDPAAGRFEEAVARQADFLRSIADDNGRLPLIGDDDGGQLFPMCGREPADCRDTLAAAAIALKRPDLALGTLPEEVFWLCGTAMEAPPGALPARAWPSRAFFDTGYFVSRNTRGDHAVFDAGPHGFLNGGHAHADALSLVITLGGTPLLVDPGTATYTMAPAVRDLFRSTAMHNTVVVNGAPQSVPRGPFHWERRAAARPAVWRRERAFDYVEAFHDGYAPLAHTRVVVAVHGVGWFVVDRVLGDGTAAAETFWHVHPAWRVMPHGTHGVEAHQRGRAAALVCSTPVRLLEGPEEPGLHSYAPAYGRIERGTCVTASVSGPLPLAWLTFVPAVAGGAGDVAVEPVEVCHPPPDEWHGAAFRVRVADDEYTLLTAVEREPLLRAAPAADAAHTTRGPAAVWGCGFLGTDARAALVRTRSAQREASERVALVNGREVRRLSSHVASSVHDSPVAGAG
jgi:hypothetical protein